MKPYGMRFLKEDALQGSASSCIYGYGGIRRRRGCRRTRRRKAGGEALKSHLGKIKWKSSF